MATLRLIHILAGVFWAGTTFFVVSFLQPAIKNAGPDGGKVMQQLLKARFSNALGAVGILTVVTGILLYWQDFGLNVRAMAIGSGPLFTFGGIAGIVAFVIGLVVSGRASNRMSQIAAAMQGKPPTPEQVKEIQAMQSKLASGAYWTAVFLALALIGMATARSLRF